MSKVLTALNLQVMVGPNGVPLTNRDGRQLFTVQPPAFAYQSDVAALLIVAPVGFITDLESCPRVPLVFDTVGDVIVWPAVVHDYLYSAKSNKMVTRAMADAVLLEAMALSGVPYWKRYAIYWGVRVGGGSHFGT